MTIVVTECQWHKQDRVPIAKDIVSDLWIL